VPIDEQAVQEVEKNVDPEQVLDALEEVEGEGGGAPGHPGSRHDAGAESGKPSAIKASTAS
jgi:hypothetical protein